MSDIIRFAANKMGLNGFGRQWKLVRIEFARPVRRRQHFGGRSLCRVLNMLQWVAARSGGLATGTWSHHPQASEKTAFRGRWIERNCSPVIMPRGPRLSGWTGSMSAAIGSLAFYRRNLPESVQRCVEEIFSGFLETLAREAEAGFARIICRARRCRMGWRSRSSIPRWFIRCARVDLLGGYGQAFSESPSLLSQHGMSVNRNRARPLGDPIDEAV